MLKWLKGLFRPHYLATFYLKGGGTLRVHVTDLSVTTNGMGALNGIEWKTDEWCRRRSGVAHLSAAHVAAVEVRRV